MRKLQRVKRGLCVILIAVAMGVVFIPPIHVNAQVSTEYAMFDLYRGNRGLGDINSIDDQELFVWGFFLSNYLEPFASGDKQGYRIFTGEKSEYLYFGQPDYKDSLDKLFKKVLQFQIAGERKYLVQKGSGIVATFSTLLEDNVEIVLNTGNKELTVFNSNNDISNIGLLISLAKGKGVLSSITYEGILDTPICLDAFGNILLEDNRVVIPAVLNPYIISENGDKFLFINDYTLANYAFNVGHPNSVMNIERVLNWDRAAQFKGSTVKQEYRSYLYFTENENKDNLGFLADRVEDTAIGQSGITQTSGFLLKDFERDFGLPSLSMLFKNKLATKNFNVIAYNNYTSYKQRVISALGGLTISEETLQAGREEAKKILTELEEEHKEDQSDIELSIYLDNSAVETSEYRATGILGLFNIKSELGEKINAKISAMNKGVLKFKSTDILNVISLPESDKDIKMLNTSVDSTEFGINLLKGALDISTSSTEGKGLWDKAKNILGQNMLNIVIRGIMNEYMYNMYTLNERDLFREFTIADGDINTLGDNFIVTIYYTYLKLYFGHTEGYQDWRGFNSELVDELIGMAEYNSLIAELMTERYLEESDEKQKEDLLKNIRGLLDPDDATYRVKQLNSTANKWIIDTHYKLANADKADITSSGYRVQTGYSGLNNFVTTPTLKQTPFISGMINNYLIWYIIFFIAFLIVGVIFFIIGAKTFKELAVFLLIVSLVLIIPPYLIDFAVETSNQVSEGIFSNKLGMWALTQHQQYLLDIENQNNNISVVNSIQSIRSAKGNRGVLLKWNAEKKINPYENLYSMNLGGGSQVNLNIFKWISSGFLQQEFYPDSTSYYLYRSLYDVARTSNEAYNLYDIPLNTRVKQVIDQDGEVIYTYFDIAKEREKLEQEGKYYYFPKFSKAKPVHYDSFLLNKGLGMPEQEKFTSTDMDLMGLDTKNVVIDNHRNYNEQFLINTEGVYYYFYNVLRDYMFDTPTTTLEGSSEINSGFSRLLIEDDIFKVTSRNSRGYDRIKDFLDMENLFKNLLPNMKAYNTLALRKINDKTAPLEDIDYWSYFSVWASAIERSDYGKNDYVLAINSKYKLINSFDYTEYESYRPMVFSEAQQIEQGYENMSLTLVETKILKVLEKTYIDFRGLINNYGFSDESLLSMAALQATFNFNNEFSRSFVFRDNADLYPKTYDLRGFNYDTIMKMMLVTSTGETLFGDSLVYERIIDNSSWLSGVFLFLCDILAIWIVSTLRYIYIILVFVMAYILILYYGLSSVKNIDTMLKAVQKGLFTPIITYFIASIAQAFLNSLLVSDAYSNIIGNSGTVVLNSPIAVFLWFILINSLYVVVLFRTIVKLFKEAKVVVVSTGMMAMTYADKIGQQIRNKTKDWLVKDSYEGSESGSRQTRREKAVLKKLKNKEKEVEDTYGDYLDNMDDSIAQMQTKTQTRKMTSIKKSKHRSALANKIDKIEKKDETVKSDS